jgi:hypothetical protein
MGTKGRKKSTGTKTCWICNKGCYARSQVCNECYRAEYEDWDLSEKQQRIANEQLVKDIIEGQLA